MSLATREAINDHIAQELRAEMGRKRVSMSEMARRMDVEHTWLFKRLTGTIPLRIGEVIEIAGLLKVPLDKLQQGLPDVSAEGRIRKTLSSYLGLDLRLPALSCA